MLQVLVEDTHVVAPLIALDRAAWPDALGLEVERKKGVLRGPRQGVSVKGNAG